jgi:CRP-like cAMP-binding protein
MKREKLEREFSGEEPILDSGSNKRELFVVRSGNVMLIPNDGSEQRLLGPGEIFGELGAIVGEPSPYAVRADGDASVVALDPAALNRLCKQSPDFSARIILHLAQELAGAGASQVSPGDERLQYSLQCLVPVILQRRKSSDLPSPVAGCLADLATGAGLSILETYFCLQSLLERRYLQLADDQLTLVAADALEELAR